jgi:hypothetical protein
VSLEGIGHGLPRIRAERFSLSVFFRADPWLVFSISQALDHLKNLAAGWKAPMPRLAIGLQRNEELAFFIRVIAAEMSLRDAVAGVHDMTQFEGTGPGSNPRSPTRQRTGLVHEATPRIASFSPCFQGFFAQHSDEQDTLSCTVHLYMFIIGYEVREVKDGRWIFLEFARSN